MEFLTRRLDLFLDETRNADKFFNSERDSFGDNYLDIVSKITNSVLGVMDEIKVNVRKYPIAFKELKNHISITAKDVISRISELHTELKTPEKYDYWWLGHWDKFVKKNEISPYHFLDQQFNSLKEKVIKQKIKLLRQVRNAEKKHKVSLTEIPEKKQKKITSDFQHPIFTNDFALKLFEHLHEEYRYDEKHNLVNYSFIYWKMQKDKYIYNHIRPMQFVTRLNDDYQIVIPKLHPENRVINSIDKKRVYNSCVQALKSEIFRVP